MGKWRALALALLIAAPAQAFACSPMVPPERPPTQAEIDDGLRATFGAARDLIEFEVVRRATPDSLGAIRVTRSLKRTTRPGAILRLSTSDGPACGAGNAERGTRGRMFLSGEAPHEYRPMGDVYYGEFVRLGLVPAQ